MSEQVQRGLAGGDISTVLAAAGELLRGAGIPDPTTDVALLLAHAWGLDSSGLSRKRLFAEQVPGSVISDFAQLIERRSTRVPLQHLTGRAAFRHLDLEVGPGVFIPRPETELLVTEVLDELARQATNNSNQDAIPFVIDLCSGSGAISLSLAYEHPQVRVLGVEKEPAALDWSGRNLSRVDVGSSEVEFVSGDATSFADTHPELLARANVVVTNPPYVPDSAIPRDPEVRDHDPAAALYGGATGLEIPALIIDQAQKLLWPGGFFIMEHSEEQGPSVRRLIAGTECLKEPATFPDYTGRDRYTVARRG